MKRYVSWYAWLASRPPLAALNDALLKRCSQARGYNNCCDPRATGEAFFVREVLKGAASSIRRYCPRFIQLEFNRHQLFRDRSLLWFADQLPEHDVYQLIPNGWVRRDPTDPLVNIFEYSHFVFVRRL